MLLFAIDSRYEEYTRRDTELEDTVNRLYNDLESDAELEIDERTERTIVGLAPSQLERRQMPTIVVGNTYKELGNRGIRDDESNVKTEDETALYPPRYTIPKLSIAYTFPSEHTIYKHLVAYSRRFRVTQLRNGSRKYNNTSDCYRFALIYIRGDTKKKLVTDRKRLKKKAIQKNECPIRIQYNAVDKHNIAIQSFSVSTNAKHNYRSIDPIGLPFYRRQIRGKRFREALLRCKRNRVSPTAIRTMLKDEFIIQASLIGEKVVLVLRDIYNEYSRFRYSLISNRTLVDVVLVELNNNSFFVRYEASNNYRLRCIFFVYLELIKIYKNNAKVLIYDCTYKVYASSILLLCFDFINRLGQCLLLAYVLIEDKTFEGYEQAFNQLKVLFKEYNIDDLDLIIYDRNRAAMNAIKTVFIGAYTILYTQYIDTAVRANTYKIFGQQKDKNSNRYIASLLVEEFIILYKQCRYVPTEDVFNKAYTAID